MKKIVVDMQNFLFGDSIAAAFKNSNYDIDVVRAETPQDTVELCRVYKPFCADVNGDGTINAKDKKIIYGHINDSTTELTGYIFDVGDVNKDGVINAKDKKQIFGHINGTSLWS